ncbi:MAG: succinate dehydrogenase, cytochrome b556 subunit [Alphaproteobacteria bacterium]|jgi:succinate dehydrogenase / fumarate reductase cytochrome b subunit|nr:succinate dehydrogenase, cytochrome b556 subunit [Rhodospirillaceae bacterium]MDP6021285.1 succinate dehydrogenase, cytochrome b556 subunit [Alphaproteobacteria bacterium]MDP6254936.1 succinate dehydrogenase, cytochrome b556 subunit [Alphaproteobacteria bacterium]MDP7054010.1 succinate dehydrogenase, cytochrome b556 subunit [Alphaproteobacteria bacterium]MDP7227321.1 succinate dehydrogenase, cytochrome b556 subunit [Alphaproteobacteria bacterium]|tara:strand:+ start:11091 stop:11477 length:387 start_codon:yes stop_codon:yes gene_type:complete
MAAGNRPLSPHLQVYRWQISMALSILHRITGVGLALGLLLLTWWLAAAASGPEYFDTVYAIMGSEIGRVLLFGFTVSLYFHLFNGIRHLIWDAGYGFELPAMRKSGWAVVVISVVMTLLTFMVGYGSA